MINCTEHCCFPSFDWSGDDHAVYVWYGGESRESVVGKGDGGGGVINCMRVKHLCNI